MSATAYVDGVDRSSYLISSERQDEYCNPGARVNLSFDTEFACETWDSVVLYEDGTKTFTGTIVRIDNQRKETRTLDIIAKDEIRRLREYFVVDDYVTEGEGVRHWIGTIAGLAGCSITFTEDYGPTELAGMTIGRMFAYEIIDELLLYAGWDIWCNANGNMRVGFRFKGPTEHTIAAGDNLSSFDRSQDSEPPRNAAMVYTVLGTAYVHRDFGWEIDNKDIRTMVVSSIYVDTIGKAADLANRMLSVAGPTYDIVRCILDAVDTSIQVGEKATYDSGAGETGADNITTIISKMTGGGTVEELHVTMGERCPKVGAGGLMSPIDGRDVIVATHECGVWRCKDIWENTPHWEPLNSGLVDVFAVGEGSTFKCEWFIRDPYQPNDLTYLLTQAGIMYTESTEPGLELWLPRKMNYELQENMKFTRIRSTVARQGAYFYTIMDYSGGGESTRVGLTNDGFLVTYFDDFSRVPETIDYACVTGQLWGGCNYGHQKQSAGPQPWHSPHGPAYVAEPGGGGLAAWHKNDDGCTATGIQSAFASNGGPAGWNCERESGVLVNYEGIHRNGDEIFRAPSIDHVTTSCWLCYGTGHPLDPPCTWGSRPLSDISFTYNTAGPWLKLPTIHIPYDQKYTSEGLRGGTKPAIIYYSPGEWVGNPAVTWAAYPTRNGTPLLLPWGADPSLCHILQGSIGTYSPDRTKVRCFSWGSPSRFAVSSDEGLTWSEKGSIPFWTSCFSGFPTSSSKLYAGRDPTRGPSNNDDRALIYVSWDTGDNWSDVTGDLWTQTQALSKRFDILDDPIGTAGLVTIAPRYC